MESSVAPRSSRSCGVASTAPNPASVRSASLQASPAIAVRGHCIEQHGTPEPYLAIIEMLGRLRQSARGKETLDVLVKYAPMFLSNVPNLAPAEQLDALRERARDGNATRMMRELMDAFEALSANHTVVLVFEDLQWSDVATLDLLALVGARRERARLLVVATSRRVEAQTVTHPLNPVMRSLVTRSRAASIALERVASDAIAALLAARFPAHGFPDELVETLDRITAGTPLFLVSILDDLVARDMIAQRDGRWGVARELVEFAKHHDERICEPLLVALAST